MYYYILQLVVFQIHSYLCVYNIVLLLSLMYFFVNSQLLHRALLLLLPILVKTLNYHVMLLVEMLLVEWCHGVSIIRDIHCLSYSVVEYMDTVQVGTT